MKGLTLYEARAYLKKNGVPSYEKAKQFLEDTDECKRCKATERNENNFSSILLNGFAISGKDGMCFICWDCFSRIGKRNLKRYIGRP